MIAPIGKYISELLYEHNCVVVPGFGGFIGNYSPARIDPVKHLFEPPGKSILFNKGLVQNDGLLAHHISHSRNISYSMSLEYIAGEVKRIQSALLTDKRVTLDNIGLLYTDEHGALLFQPDEKLNYLPEAFGLSSFYRLPLDHTGEKTKIVELKTPKSYRKLAAAAVAGAIVASTVWLSLNTKNPGIDYSSLNIFAKKEIRHYRATAVHHITAVSYSKDSVNAIAFLNNAPTGSSAVISSPKARTEAGNYLIIAGCFRILENAQGLVRKMQQQQINAAIIGTNPQGLFMVGYGGFGTREEAESSLENFRRNHIADAWLFEARR